MTRQDLLLAFVVMAIGLAAGATIGWFMSWRHSSRTATILLAPVFVGLLLCFGLLVVLLTRVAMGYRTSPAQPVESAIAEAVVYGFSMAWVATWFAAVSARGHIG